MSELNIVDSSINLFNLDKPEIVFNIKSNSNISNNQNFSNSLHNPIYLGQTSLIVTNLTSEYLAFRTKTTKKKYYSLYPSYCVITPNKKEKIDFSYYIKEGEKPSNEGHKFKFEGFVITPEEKNKDAKLLFNTYISKKTPVKATVIKCGVVFIEKEEKEENNNINKNKMIYNPLSNKSLNVFSENTILQQEESFISKEKEKEKEKENIKEKHLIQLDTNKNKNSEKDDNFELHNDFGTPKIKKIGSTKKLYDYNASKTEEETNALLNKLKVEYYKLKNELDILKNNYYNLRNHVDLEENEQEDIREENDKNNYPSIHSKEIKLAPSICVVLFILAIILGFYLS